MKRAFLAVWLLAGLTAACDGSSDAGGPGFAHEPALAGEPLATCEIDRDCAPGASCIEDGFVIGHCFPRGSGGGACREPDDVAGRCDRGLQCAGKFDRCVPLVGAGASCTAAACEAGSRCGELDEVRFCASEGTAGGPCRAMAPACDTGLGCNTRQRCSPLDGAGRCYDGEQVWGCPDGQICPSGPDAASRFAATCVTPGAFGKPCRPVAAERSRCDADLGCFLGRCEAFVLPTGTACQPGGGHGRCEDGSSCQVDVCVADGVAGGQCRAAGPPGTPCDPGLTCAADGLCRSHLNEGAACVPGAPAMGGPPCRTGTSCVPVEDGTHICLRDGAFGGACRGLPSACAPGLQCHQVRTGESLCGAGLPAGAVCNPMRLRFEPCVEGTSCALSDSTCRADGTLGASCRGDLTCDAGLFCAPFETGFFCFAQPPLVTPGQGCDDNERTYQRKNRCPDDAFCIGKICRVRGSASAPCRPFSDPAGACDDGLACDQGICLAGRPVGAACLTGSLSECARPAICAGPTGAATCTAGLGYTESPLPANAIPVDGCDPMQGVPLTFAKVRTEDDPRDDGFATVKLPFAFRFWGTDHDEVSVRPDGVLGFPPPSDVFSPGTGGNGALPALGVPALIAPFWDDLHLGDPRTSRVCRRQVGGADPAVIIEWRTVGRFGRATTRLDFAAALHASGVIDFHYRRLQVRDEADGPFVTGVRAAIGLQSAGAAARVVHTGRVRAANGLRFVPLL